MGRIVVVRHGQASMHRSDYDQLSTLGTEQSEALGHHWAGQAFVPDAVFIGPAKRHAQTHAAVTGVLGAAALEWPAAIVLPGLDEHDAFGLVREALAERDDPALQDLQLAVTGASTPAERSRSFQRIFEVVMRRWLAGTCNPAGIETWPRFHARVVEALGVLEASSRGGRRVVAFSSVGPVASMLHHALECSATRAFEVGWRLRNTGLSSFVAGRGIPTLDRFNAVPHLPRSEHHTYR